MPFGIFWQIVETLFDHGKQEGLQRNSLEGESPPPDERGEQDLPGFGTDCGNPFVIIICEYDEPFVITKGCIGILITLSDNSVGFMKTPYNMCENRKTV